jgi:LPXTG-site transpeptidase (sortase) family protein
MLLDSVGYDLKDLEPRKMKERTFFSELFKNLFLIFSFSIVCFVIINLPAYYQIGLYKFSPHKNRYEFPTIEEMRITYSYRLPDQVSASPTVNPNITVSPIVTGTPEPAKAALAPNVNQYSDNTVFIPKIGVKAPIGWDISSDKITGELEKHVVHVQGSVKPGEKGNIFLTGHSSNYWWKKGDFNTVFALLPELKKDDQIILTNKGKFYYYKVTSTVEVKPADVSNYFSSNTEQLTLMTCVPVGTNLKRLLIFASPQ